MPLAGRSNCTRKVLQRKELGVAEMLSKSSQEPRESDEGETPLF